MVKYILKYLRLSLDDGGDGESNSIENQRYIIDDYISAIPEFTNIPVLEFSDDGYTGTNFERPGIKKLLEAVRCGEVSCIVVKDLSRFGRKYLEVSKYIEQLFPYLGVRFISVNDHYDSESHKGTTAEMDVPLRNLINAYYSKQVSKKVKDAKQMQIRQGKNINAFVRYGYMKDPQDNHRVIIDEPAAAIVRRIFGLACNGNTPTQIAKTLNADNILTPLAYKKQNGSKINNHSMITAIWTMGSIITILREEQYTGFQIYGKVETGELGTGKRIYKHKNEWLRIQGTLPAIITMEIWETVVSKRGKYCGEHGKFNTRRILFKRVRCGYCGHVMVYQTKNSKYNHYSCRTLKISDINGCKSRFYQEKWIVNTVKSILQKQITLMLDMEKLCREHKMNTQKNTESAQTATIHFENEMTQLQISKRQLYERYKNGMLEKSDYFNEREMIETQINYITSEREALLIQSNKQESVYNSVQRFFNSFTMYQADTEPTAEVVNALVESVNIFDKDRIEVKFSFKDEWEQIMASFFLVTT